jgi:hypothetical protein
MFSRKGNSRQIRTGFGHGMESHHPENTVCWTLFKQGSDRRHRRSDAGGIDLTVTETNEATGIFEGTVFFTVNNESSGHRLRVSEGDTVTAEYEDNTLPEPYTTADELNITATTLIGTVVPPLERAPAANLRTVDAFGNSLDTVSVDQHPRNDKSSKCSSIGEIQIIGYL